MSLVTRYRITDIDVPEVRSFSLLAELPMFIRTYSNRVASIDDMILVVSNRRHIHPTYVSVHAFHRHRSAYAAIDSLAHPLGEFFLETGILPIVKPIDKRFKSLLEDYAPQLYVRFADRGILVPREEFA